MEERNDLNLTNVSAKRKRRGRPLKVEVPNKKSENRLSNAQQQCLLDRLQHQEKLFVMNSIPHNLIPSFNIHVKKTEVNDIHSTPTFKCSVPNAIFVSATQPKKLDLCHKRTQAHSDYILKLKRQHIYYDLAKKKKNMNKSMKENVYPSVVFSFAELLENNPDPYFHSKYDWYYTGGNLFNFVDSNLLCHSNSENLNELCLSRIKKTLKVKRLSVMDFQPKHNIPCSEIFEIQPTKLNNRFTVRQKHFISVLNKTDNILYCDYVLESHNVPFITSTSGFADREILVTGDLNRVIKLWDLEWSTEKPKQTLYSETVNAKCKSKNWNCIRTIDDNTYVMANLNEFGLIDSRQSQEEIKQNFCTFMPYSEFCENISALAVSNFDYNIYFATTHKLFTIDSRFIGHELQNKYIVQRWTHQMDSQPIMLKTFQIDDKHELIGMSGLLSGDIRICENFMEIKKCEFSYMSASIPFMPPSLFENYHSAQKNGKCLDPFTSLKNRISSCTTGLDFYQRNNNLYLLFANSIGDVFNTEIKFDSNTSNEDDINSIEFNEFVMEKYEKNVKNRMNKNPVPLNLTDIEDFSGIGKIIRCKRLSNLDNLTKSAVLVEDDEPKRPPRKPKWQKSINQLMEYKDVLAANLLSVWDIEVTDQKPLSILSQKSEKIEANGRISEWLSNWNHMDSSLFELNGDSAIDDSFIPDIQSTLRETTQSDSFMRNVNINSTPFTKVTAALVPLKSMSFGDDNESDFELGQTTIIQNKIDVKETSAFELTQGSLQMAPAFEMTQCSVQMTPAFELTQGSVQMAPDFEMTQCSVQMTPAFELTQGSLQMAPAFEMTQFSVQMTPAFEMTQDSVQMTPALDLTHEIIQPRENAVQENRPTIQKPKQRKPFVKGF